MPVSNANPLACWLGAECDSCTAPPPAVAASWWRLLQARSHQVPLRYWRPFGAETDKTGQLVDERCGLSRGWWVTLFSLARSTALEQAVGVHVCITASLSQLALVNCTMCRREPSFPCFSASADLTKRFNSQCLHCESGPAAVELVMSRVSSSARQSKRNKMAIVATASWGEHR